MFLGVPIIEGSGLVQSSPMVLTRHTHSPAEVLRRLGSEKRARVDELFSGLLMVTATDGEEDGGITLERGVVSGQEWNGAGRWIEAVMSPVNGQCVYDVSEGKTGYTWYWQGSGNVGGSCSGHDHNFCLNVASSLQQLSHKGLVCEPGHA